MVESPGTRCVKHGMRATALGVAAALRLSSYGLVRRKLLSLLVSYRPLAYRGIIIRSCGANCTLGNLWNCVRTALMPSGLALYADDSFLTDNSRAQQLGWPPSNLASPRSSGQHANGCRITSRCRQHPLI